MTDRPAPRSIGLDAVRGLAVAAVVAYHLGFLRGGFLGVDVFFVLSGYLITALALAERDRTGRFALREFWGRRVRRLGPALFTVVPIVLVLAHLVGWDRTAYRAVSWDAFTTLTWTNNWRQALAGDGGYWADTPSLFRHAWSLSIEEQFYLLWPLLLVGGFALAARWGGARRRVVFAVAAGTATASAVWSIVLAHRLEVADLSRVYAGTDTRIFGPLVGCALACVWPLGGRPIGPGIRGLTLAAGALAAAGLVWATSTFGVSEPTMYRWGVLPLTALATAVVIVAATGLRRVDPVTVWAGRRSYAIYLWSWPIQLLVAHRWSDLAAWQIAAITVPSSLVLAEVSWHLIEFPAQRRIRWAARPTIRRAAGAGAAAVALSTVAFVAVGAKPPPAHERFDTDEALRTAMRVPPTTRPEADRTGKTTPEADESEQVMLVGDSVAFSVGFYAPRDGSLPDGVASVDGRGVIGCSLLSALDYEQETSEGTWRRPSGGRCAEVEQAIDAGLSGSPDVVVIMPGAWEMLAVRSSDGEVIESGSTRMAELLQNRIMDLARRTGASGGRVLLLPWACPGGQTMEGRRDREYIVWINRVMARAAEQGRTEGLDVRVAGVPEAVCSEGDATGEPTDAKNQATEGGTHIRSSDGGRWIWSNWLGPEIARTRPAPEA